MKLTDRALLRLHVEAVWGVSLPAIDGTDIELLPESLQPDWQLLIAEVAGELVRIWRADVPDTIAQASLFWRGASALALPIDVPTAEGIKREIALTLASPLSAGRIAQARGIARPLTVADNALIEEFEVGNSKYYLSEARCPLVGVLESGRLVCVAHSSRRTGEACELGVETLPEARRKGYAQAVTTVWADLVQQEGLVPLYSAFADNTPSLKLAASVGYRMFARVATVRVDDD